LKLCRAAAAAAEAEVVGPVAEVEAAGWKCVKNCGACCYLAPEDRPYLADLLSVSELATFKGLVAEDGWCRHYDKERRNCKIFEDRPSFCRVKTWLSGKAEGFGVDPTSSEELGIFCAEACRENIQDVFGAESPEMERYNAEVTVYPPDEDMEGWEEVGEGDSDDGEDEFWDETDEMEDLEEMEQLREGPRAGRLGGGSPLDEGRDPP